MTVYVAMRQHRKHVHLHVCTLRLCVVSSACVFVCVTPCAPLASNWSRCKCKALGFWMWIVCEWVVETAADWAADRRAPCGLKTSESPPLYIPCAQLAAHPLMCVHVGTSAWRNELFFSLKSLDVGIINVHRCRHTLYSAVSMSVKKPQPEFIIVIIQLVKWKKEHTGLFSKTFWYKMIMMMFISTKQVSGKQLHLHFYEWRQPQ